MGVEFVQITPADRAALRDFLQERATSEPGTEADLDL
jgi:hypothetical protein